MTRYWTCRGCSQRWPRTKKLCTCGRRRPAARKPSHMRALEQPYEWWVREYGEVCGICGRGPSANRRLDRDHDHRGDGRSRGLLCARCNRALPSWCDAAWLRAAADYLERAEAA